MRVVVLGARSDDPLPVRLAGEFRWSAVKMTCLQLAQAEAATGKNTNKQKNDNNETFHFQPIKTMHYEQLFFKGSSFFGLD